LSSIIDPPESIRLAFIQYRLIGIQLGPLSSVRFTLAVFLIVTVLANISFLIVELYLIHQRPVCFALAVSSATNILVQH